MAEEQQNTPATGDAQPALISLTPEQMEQFTAAMAFFDQFRTLIQSPDANTPPATPPASSQPTTPSLAAKTSKARTSSPKGPKPSPKATKRSSSSSSSSKPKNGKASRTRYECERSDSGQKSIRRCRTQRPAPFDPQKDPRMICHTAAHNICSKIIRGMGFRGEW